MGVGLVLYAFYGNQDGATAIEYALIASIISVGIIGALLLFQGEMSDMFQYISDHISPVLGE